MKMCDNFFETLRHAVEGEYVIRLREIFDGYALTVWFENGYGASILSHSHIYGGQDGLLEVAIVIPEDNFYDQIPVYDTPITDCSVSGVDGEYAIEVLREIENLPVRG